jgi:hypothetical protein
MQGMAFDLATYQRLTGQLDLDGIDFDAFRDQPLAPGHLRVLRYMHDVEQHTTCYLRNLLNTKAHHDPDITAFLMMWGYEEYWHGEALGRVLEAHGERGGAPRVAAMRERLGGWKLTASPLGWMALSSATKHFIAVHMTFGVINEWTTQAGYARLGAQAGHPVLSELLRRIMKQEGRHIDFYRSTAEGRLAASRGAQRTTRFVVRKLWEPVGASVMPEPETRHLIGTLFADEDGRAVVARLDRRVDALPGLEGLGLMTGALTTYAPTP